jgi:hypothetical protein
MAAAQRVGGRPLPLPHALLRTSCAAAATSSVHALHAKTSVVGSSSCMEATCLPYRRLCVCARAAGAGRSGGGRGGARRPGGGGGRGHSRAPSRGGGRGSSGGRGAGRYGSSGGGRGSTSSSGRSSASNYRPKWGPPIPSSDIVVIGKAAPRYLPEDEEALAAQEGGSFWATAWRAEFGDDADEDEDEEEEEGEEGGLDGAGRGQEEGGEGEDDDEAAEANFAAVLQVSWVGGCGRGLALAAGNSGTCSPFS